MKRLKRLGVGLLMIGVLLQSACGVSVGPPQESKPNSLTMYNGSCCMVLENFEAKMLLTDGSEIRLLSDAAPVLYSTQSATLPSEGFEGPVKVEISFYFEYPECPEGGDVSFVAAEYSTMEELVKQGILLKFGDGDLIVQTGKDEMRFSCYVNPLWAPE